MGWTIENPDGDSFNCPFAYITWLLADDRDHVDMPCPGSCYSCDFLNWVLETYP